MENKIKNKFLACPITLYDKNECNVIRIHTDKNDDTINEDIDNYILLHDGISRSFINYEWSFNPISLSVEIAHNDKNRMIYKYKDRRVVEFNKKTLLYLNYHYDIFRKKILGV